jgi:hypothetical protein
MENKVKNRLYEMFNKVCGTNFINENDQVVNNKTDENVFKLSDSDIKDIMAGHVKITIDALKGILIKFNLDKEEKSDELEYDNGDEELEYPNDEDVSDSIGYSEMFKLKEFKKLIDIYEKMGSDKNQFIIDYIDEDSQIELFNDIKYIEKYCGPEMIKKFMANAKLDIIGVYIYMIRNKMKTFELFNLDYLDKFEDACGKIGAVDIDIDKGKLIYVKTSGKGGEILMENLSKSI